MPLHRQPSRGCPVRGGDGRRPLAPPKGVGQRRHGALHRRRIRCGIARHGGCGRQGCRLRRSVATRRAHALFHPGPGRQPFNGAIPLYHRPCRGCPARGGDGSRLLAPPEGVGQGRRHGALHRRRTGYDIAGHGGCGRQGCRLRRSIATHRAHALFHSGPGRQPFANQVRRNSTMPLHRRPNRECPARGGDGSRPPAPLDEVEHGRRHGALHRRRARCGIAGHGGCGRRGCRLQRPIAISWAGALFHAASFNDAHHGGNGARTGDERRRADLRTRRRRRDSAPRLIRCCGGPFRGPVR